MEAKMIKLVLELNGEPTPIFIDYGTHTYWFTAIAIMDPVERGIKFVAKHTVIDKVCVDEIETIEIVRDNKIIDGKLQYITSLEIKTK